MNPQDASPFFSRPQPTSSDNPLSPKGRFGRLSSIGWYVFIHLVTFFATIAFSLAIGIVNFSTQSIDNDIVAIFTSLSGLGFLVIMLLYVYFLMVISIRRLHDMNRSGWFSVFLFIPVLNVLIGLYLLLGSGTAGINRYGLPRHTPVWEKILAWLMIIITILSMFASSTLLSYMLGAGDLEMPQDIIQKGTEYF